MSRDAYRRQRNRASHRGIAWQFTYETWWKVWQDSGHWDDRGVGADRYCMCRRGDAGPYAPNNVFIATNSENSRAIDRCTSRGKTLPIGVSKKKNSYVATRSVNGVHHYIGCFPTPELASAAYQNFTV